MDAYRLMNPHNYSSLIAIKSNRFHCSSHRLSRDTKEKHYWALLTAQLSNETEDIIAVKHQRLCLCDTYLIKSYWLWKTHGVFCAHRYSNAYIDPWIPSQCLPLSLAHTDVNSHSQSAYHRLAANIFTVQQSAEIHWSPWWNKSPGLWAPPQTHLKLSFFMSASCFSLAWQCKATCIHQTQQKIKTQICL